MKVVIRSAFCPGPFTAAILLLAGVLVSAPAKAERKLGASQIRALFPGVYHVVYKKQYRVNAAFSGTGRIRADMGGAVGKGRWRVHRGELCVKFPGWPGGRERCYFIAKRTGGFAAVNNHGRTKARFRRLSSTSAAARGLTPGASRACVTPPGARRNFASGC